MSVVLANCMQIEEYNEIIVRHNTFTKLPKKDKLKVALKIMREKSWNIY